MVSTSYPSDASDWKGRFIERMGTAIASNPDIRLSLWAPPGDLPAGVSGALEGDDADFLQSMLERGGIAHLLRSNPLRGLLEARRLLNRLGAVYRRSGVDLYHVNWLQNALALPADSRPALITVLGTDFKLLRLPGVTGRLRKVLRNHSTVIAPNAEWMAPELQRRFGDLARVRPIPFGVDDAWFDIERIPTQPRIWLVVLRLTTAKIGPLFDWCRDFFGPADELHLFGPNQAGLVVPDWVHYHGATNLEALRDDWYPRATAMITLSQHSEGRPQVLIEAMAAGLPIVASAQPAHADLVRDGDTGFLVDDESGYRKALCHLADPDTNLQTGRSARAFIAREIGTWQTAGARYVAAYRELAGAV